MSEFLDDIDGPDDWELILIDTDEEPEEIIAIESIVDTFSEELYSGEPIHFEDRISIHAWKIA